MVSGPLDSVSLNLVDSVDDAFELMRWLSTVRGPLAVDTETTGLSIDRDRVRLIQVGDADTGWAMNSERWGGVFEDISRRWEGQYLMHNAKYDDGMLRGWGCSLPRGRILDTRLMSHVLHPNESTALKKLASKYVDPRAASAQAGLDKAMNSRTGGWGWDNVPITKTGPMAIYWQYGALDPVLTRRVYDVLYPQVMSEAPAAFELENAVSWVVANMERRGAVVDRDYAARYSEQFLAYVDQLEAWCTENYGVKPGANAHVVSVLETFGFEFDKLTKTGAKALDKFVLEATNHPLARAVLTRRRVQKLQSTYLRRFLEYSQWDGFLHPNINVVGGSSKSQVESGGDFGVRTSRMSMDTPNLQQLPRHGTNQFADVVRNCIVAREGHTLLMCDFDQIEMRLLAHLSGDEGMRAAFHEPVDFFTAMARTIYSEPDFQKKDPRRQIIKNSGYAKAYGAGAEKFGLTAGITTSEAETFMARFDSLYPSVQRWIVDKIRESRQHKANEGESYVRSPMTNRKLLPDEDYAAVNYTIQCLAAETFKTKLLELDAAGLGEYLILPVHDEAILDVPDDLVGDATHTLNGVMNDHTFLSVPLTAGLATGQRWGEKEEVEWPAAA